MIWAWFFPCVTLLPTLYFADEKAKDVFLSGNVILPGGYLNWLVRWGDGGKEQLVFLGEAWGGCLSVPKGCVHHAVLEMFSAGAGGVQILAKSLNRADFALSGEGREEASAT